jgi:NDP-sugar pyrophosphorylase family protein
VDVAGEPFLHRQLGYLREQGIGDVVLCTGYLGEQIEAAVGNGAALGVRVDYSLDGHTLLGTGGALRRALPLLGDAFFVLYGDSFLPCDFGAVARSFEQRAKPALMTVLRNQDRWDKSNVIYRDGQVLLYDKQAPQAEMAYIDYGLSVFRATVLAEEPADTAFDLADVFHRLSVAGDLAGYEVTERFYEIGSPEGLQETVDYFSKRSGQ